MELVLSSFQTVGPYFSIGLSPLYRHNLTEGVTDTDTIKITGRVIDGDGVPVPDAVIEIWQADSAGIYSDSCTSRPGFRGYGRSSTDEWGHYQFTTIKPGGVAFGDGRMQAPHIAVNLQMRGLLNRLVTRIYFDNEPANQSDPVLNLIPEERRGTVIARMSANNVYVFDFNLQGENETVFFDI